MATGVGQRTNNANWGALGKATELKSRIFFVLGALLVYRLGTYIPVPGIDPVVWQEIFDQKGGGILDMFNMFSGGALSRMTIFALNVMPYISASIVMQVLTATSKRLEELKKEGAAGQMKITQYTRYLAVLLATVQAYGMAVGLEALQGQAGSAVINPGLFFRASTVITIVGGTVFLMWLGEQITSRGVGNGVSIILVAGILASWPRSVGGALELARQGALSSPLLLVLTVLVVGIFAFIIYFERAQRRVLVQYPKRQVGNKMSQAQTNHMPLKVNTPGVMPPIMATALLFAPVTYFSFTNVDGGGFMGEVSRQLQHGQPVFAALYGAMIVLFSFVWLAVTFNPVEKAKDLRQSGGFIPGIRPGKNTADYLDYVLTRINVVGAAYLVAICLLPEFLIAQFNVPFYFGGTSVLIVVVVLMNTFAEAHSHMVAHQYEGLIKKTKLRGRRR